MIHTHTASTQSGLCTIIPTWACIQRKTSHRLAHPGSACVHTYSLQFNRVKSSLPATLTCAYFLQLQLKLQNGAALPSAAPVTPAAAQCLWRPAVMSNPTALPQARPLQQSVWLGPPAGPRHRRPPPPHQSRTNTAAPPPSAGAWGPLQRKLLGVTTISAAGKGHQNTVEHGHAPSAGRPRLWRAAATSPPARR